ncbi:MAG: hypothetical protein OIF32_11035, partial [Campylobacterales bacterium]|nr:hypothetical protein [Campylobacterales bacterium]
MKKFTILFLLFFTTSLFGGYELATSFATAGGSSTYGVGLTKDSSNNLYASNQDGKIYKITPSGTVTELANGLGLINGISMVSANNRLYVSIYNSGGNLHHLDYTSSWASSLSEVSVPGTSRNWDVVVDGSSNAYIMSIDTPSTKVSKYDGSTATEMASLSENYEYNHDGSYALAADSTHLYIAWGLDGNKKIEKIPLSGGAPVLVTNTSYKVRGMAFDSNGELYVCDSTNGEIKKINTSNGTATTIITGLSEPEAIVFDSSDKMFIYQTDGQIMQSVPTVPSLKLETHGGVLQFPLGRENYVSLPDMTFSGDITVEAWINTSSGSQHTRILELGDGSAFTFSLDASNKLYDGAVVTSTGVPHNTWTHVAIVKTGMDSIIYINGVQAASGSTATSVNGSYSTNKIHRSEATGSDNQNPILIDEMRIWNTAKTVQQIKDNMNLQLNPMNHLDLLAYYNFDERMGNKVRDLKSGNDGTIVGDVVRVNFLGDMVRFDGSGDHVSVGDIIESKSRISHVAWIKVDQYSSQSGAVIGKYQVDFLAVNNTGSLFTKFGDGTSYNESTNCVVDSKIIELNKYYHVAMTTDTTANETKLYINGKLEKTCNTSMVTGENSSIRAIGSYSPSSTGGYRFRGDISQVSTWTKALSQEEIQELMISAPDLTDSNLAGYWPLNEGSGNSTKDYSSNGNDGTITGATWVKEIPEIYGDTLYTTEGIRSWERLIGENIPSANFTQANGNIGSFSSSFGSFIHTGVVSNNLIFSETTSGLTFNGKSVVHPVPNQFKLHLQNYSPLFKKIVSIEAIEVGGGSERVIFTSNLANGSSTLKSILNSWDGTFVFKFVIDNNNDGLGDEDWFYDFGLNKLKTELESTAI